MDTQHTSHHVQRTRVTHNLTLSESPWRWHQSESICSRLMDVCVCWQQPSQECECLSEAVFRVVGISPFPSSLLQNTCVCSIVHEGWSWWCPWRWPPHSSRAGHQDQFHPVPLLSSGVMLTWMNLLLESRHPEAFPSDPAGLRQEKTNHLIHVIT